MIRTKKNAVVRPEPPAPRVSIIAPTCNHERFISVCLDSVLAQTFADWEMVVIDDASRDGTAGIVQAYARKDNRIRLIRHETNWGMAKLAATYNQGVAAGSGEWIAILEGDDAWPPWKLGQQLPPLDNTPEVVLGFGRSLLLSAAGSLLAEVQAGLPAYCRPYFRNFRGQAIEPLLLRPCFIHPVTVMVRRPALEQIGGFQQPRGLNLVDHPTFLELAGRGEFFGSSDVLGYYRRHRDSQSLNRIVELTRGERRLVFDLLDRTALPAVVGLRRRMGRSWALESARASLTEGRLCLLRGRRRAARVSFRRCLLAEKPLQWLHVALLIIKMASLAAIVLSFFPVNLERIVGWLHLRSSSLLERSDEFNP
jgi:glycosyltransferase involved in cell wall biosynthesis